jgi:DNA replication protein DnaC
MVTMERRSLTDEDLVRMCVPDRYWGVTFKGVSDGDHKEVAATYLAKIDEMVAEGVGLMLWGKNGCGKTGLLVVIGKEFRRRGYTVLFVEAANLKRAVIDNERFDADLTVFERARSVDVLLMDDLGKGVQDKTGFGARLIDELIRFRNARKKVTFITTNISPYPDGEEKSQLETELKISTLHTLKECIVPVQVEGTDFREDAKSKLVDLLIR